MRGIVEPPSMQEAKRVRLVLCLLAPLVITIALLFVPGAILQDPDNLWHVRVGLDILTSGSLPTTDTYSHTFSGHPWIATEWLGEVILALAYDAGGWNAVALAVIASIAITTLLLAWHLSADLKPVVAVGLAFVLAFYFSKMYNARPFIFTFPIIIVWTATLYRAAYEKRAPPAWLLVLLIPWANLHAGFTLAFVIALFAFFDVCERVRLSRLDLLAKWVLFGLACPVVTLLNPYGIEAILATFGVAHGNEAVPLISEWRPFDAGELPIHEAGLLALFLGLAVSKFRLGWAKALVAVLGLHLFLTHIRLLYFLLFVVPLASAPEIARQYPALSSSEWARASADGLERFLFRHFRGTAAAMAVAIAIAAGTFLVLSRVEPSPRTYAKDALAYVQQQRLAGNVFNSYRLGGTLIFHGYKTYIDGRTDQLFLDGFIKRDAESKETAGKPILKKQLVEHNITWAILTADDRRIPFFDDFPGWQQMYKDLYTVIYVRSSTSQ